MQESVSLFTKPGCPFCTKAKQMLLDRGIQYEEIVLGQDATTVSLRAMTGRATVPQVFIGGRHIGGSDDLEKFFRLLKNPGTGSVTRPVFRCAYKRNI